MVWPQSDPSPLPAAPAQPVLRRSLSLPMLTLYGLGTTIGAGIFVLVGKIAGVAGPFAPLAFLVASALAGLSAFSFAALASRFPESAGEAVYVREGLRSRWLATTVGLMVVAAGVVSSAAIVNGFIGYLAEFATVNPAAAICLTMGTIGVLAAIGIGPSVSVAVAISVAEIGALLVVTGAGIRSAGIGALIPAAPVIPAEAATWIAVFSAATLAFYAFIGFEDIVNVAEETREAARTVPRAILLTLGFTALIYISVSLVATAVAGEAALAASAAPLVLVFERATGLSGAGLAMVAAVSVLNGALIQTIMATRVLYGMARRGMLPTALGVVSARTRTPLGATAVVAGTILIFALALPVVPLARLTSFVTLGIFLAVNAALIGLLRREGQGHRKMVLPALGAAASAGLLAFQAWEAAVG